MAPQSPRTEHNALEFQVLCKMISGSSSGPRSCRCAGPARRRAATFQNVSASCFQKPRQTTAAGRARWPPCRKHRLEREALRGPPDRSARRNSGGGKRNLSNREGKGTIERKQDREMGQAGNHGAPGFRVSILSGRFIKKAISFLRHRTLVR